MSKIICDICGTTYPETAEQCPICGSTKDLSAALFGDALAEEEVVETTAKKKGGRFAESNVRKRNAPSQEEPEYDDDDEDEEEEIDEEDYDDDREEEEEEPKSNAPLVILLVIVIAALIAVTGYIFVKYFMPNVMVPKETTAATTEATTTAPVETTIASIPCDSLALTSGGEVVLGEGESWLINVMALPENTTDKIIYTSSDESVVTVNEQGKLTAVSEGTAVITISCGEEQLTCTVTCSFASEETTVPTEVTEPETEPSTEPEETTEPTKPLKDIELKVIKWPEIRFNGPNQGFTFQLDGLANNEVKWTSMDESIVTVDENGRVLNHGKGTTTIICEYGDQKLEIKVISEW